MQEIFISGLFSYISNNFSVTLEFLTEKMRCDCYISNRRVQNFIIHSMNLYNAWIKIKCSAETWKELGTNLFIKGENTHARFTTSEQESMRAHRPRAMQFS